MIAIIGYESIIYTKTGSNEVAGIPLLLYSSGAEAPKG
jgi:hypothetical protein